MTTIDFPTHLLEAAQITPQELKYQLAIYLYEQGKLSLEQASELAEVTREIFQPSFTKHNHLSLTTSLTETKLTLEQTQKEVERLQKINTQIYHFFIDVCHFQQRIQLNSIIGFSQVLLNEVDGPLTEIQKSDLNHVIRSGQRLLKMVDDIVVMLRIEASNPPEMIFEKVSLQSIIETIPSQPYRKLLIEDVSFEVGNLPADIPELWVYPDLVAAIIFDVILILKQHTDSIDRAVKCKIILDTTYNQEWVTVKIYRELSNFSSTFLTTLARVKELGTLYASGLNCIGFFISQIRVEAHGGKMDIENRAEIGATITFTLPVYQSTSISVITKEL